MAIEIIPKPPQKRPTFLTNLFLSLGIFLLVFAIIGYFYLQSIIKKSFQTLKILEENISQKRTPEIVQLENELSQWRQKIEDYNFILNSHKEATNLFEFLEKNTHPKVWWSEFNLSLASTNNLKLKGISQDFSSLQQQILIFKKESIIKNITLNKVSFEKEGIEFELEISIDPGIFKPNLSSEI